MKMNCRWDNRKLSKSVNSEWGEHCDIGNGMMAWEEPVETVRNRLPMLTARISGSYCHTQRVKTQFVCGVPVGEGSIDIDTCFKTTVNESSLTRINIETCFLHASPCPSQRYWRLYFWRDILSVKKQLFEHLKIKPLDYYYPAKISTPYYRN